MLALRARRLIIFQASKSRVFVDTPLFRSSIGKGKGIGENRIIRVITLYLESGGSLEHAQSIANHESARTTKLYERTSDRISLDEIERIPAWFSLDSRLGVVYRSFELKYQNYR